MGNRISVNDRLKKEKEERPVDELFKPTDEKVKKESKKEIKKDKEELRRQTYYISEVLIDALKLKFFKVKYKSYILIFSKSNNSFNFFVIKHLLII